MTAQIPRSVDPRPWLDRTRSATAADVRRAIGAEQPGEREMAALLSPAAADHLEAMAARAQALTRRHFGRTIQLYVPLYLSNYCSSGCVYCGFASDVDTPRCRLDLEDVEQELSALKEMGFEEVLLLTGERARSEDFDYLRRCVQAAAEHFHKVTIEVFPMEREEYHELAEQGCTGVTLYQETYDPARYDALHRWGPKKDYPARLDAPARALDGGMRSMGLGALLGLNDPAFEMLALYRHAVSLRREFWKSGVSVSFPRIRPQAGGYEPEFPVDERLLAQIICAFRICLPDVPLVLSTRERAGFRDGMAGVGVNKMSVASRTTVGGYGEHEAVDSGQFDVSDQRGVEDFCGMLREKGLEPVFKNWDMAYREPAWMEKSR